MSVVVNIPELFRSIVAKVNTKFSTRSVSPFNVYYDYGRYTEIDRRLMEKTLAKHEKYPLIWLVIPITERFVDVGDLELRNFQIIIATITKKESTTPDRYTENYIPFLWPVYDELINQIKISGYFTDLGGNVSHDKINQPYWDGKDGQQQANMFQDFIDAIQLKNISLTVNETTCDQFRIIG